MLQMVVPSFSQWTLEAGARGVSLRHLPPHVAGSMGIANRRAHHRHSTPWIASRKAAGGTQQQRGSRGPL